MNWDIALEPFARRQSSGGQKAPNSKGWRGMRKSGTRFSARIPR
jgi:hypothetical protein